MLRWLSSLSIAINFGVFCGFVYVSWSLTPDSLSYSFALRANYTEADHNPDMEIYAVDFWGRKKL